jgi:hypothetical protein
MKYAFFVQIGHALGDFMHESEKIPLPAILACVPLLRYAPQEGAEAPEPLVWANKEPRPVPACPARAV